MLRHVAGALVVAVIIAAGLSLLGGTVLRRLPDAALFAGAVWLLGSDPVAIARHVEHLPRAHGVTRLLPRTRGEPVILRLAPRWITRHRCPHLSEFGAAVVASGLLIAFGSLAR